MVKITTPSPDFNFENIIKIISAARQKKIRDALIRGGKEGGTVKGNKKEKFRDVAEEKRGGNRKILMEEN